MPQQRKPATKTPRPTDTIVVPVFRRQHVGAVTIDEKGSMPLEAAVLGVIAEHLCMRAHPEDQARPDDGMSIRPGTAVDDSFDFEYGDCRVRVHLGRDVEDCGS